MSLIQRMILEYKYKQCEAELIASIFGGADA